MTKDKAIIYLTDTLDQKRLKNLKPKTFQPSVEPESYISGSTKNIMRNQPIISYHLLPNPKDRILQLIQKTLNLVIKAVNTTINKALDQKLEPDH